MSHDLHDAPRLFKSKAKAKAFINRVSGKQSVTSPPRPGVLGETIECPTGYRIATRLARETDPGIRGRGYTYHVSAFCRRRSRR